jgi:hypothetical protein
MKNAMSNTVFKIATDLPGLANLGAIKRAWGMGKWCND